MNRRTFLALAVGVPALNGTVRSLLLTSLAWTPPTVVGTRVYLRDRRDMLVVDLA